MTPSQQDLPPSAETLVFDPVAAPENVEKVKLSPPEQEKESTSALVERYHVFTSREKWPLVVLIALAGIFSPMSANIFFSAITAVAESLHTSIQKVNLSVTCYMIAQGVSPSIWGAICDVKGRRPVLLATFCVYIAASAGLATCNSYAVLVVLRFLQACGSASVNSIGGGFISDIAERSERGGYLGLYGLGPQLGPTLGPVIGGLLTDAFGWQSVFAFLAAFSGIVFILMVVVLPETLRSLVGNGSVPPKPVNMSILYWFRHKNPGTLSPEAERELSRLPPSKSWRDIDWLAPLRMFCEWDVLMILMFNAISYTVFYTVITSTGNVLQKPYGLSETNVGLCYLAFGGGCIVAAMLNTRRLDRDYRHTVVKALDDGILDSIVGTDPEKRADFRTGKLKVRLDQLQDFPIEYARLHTIPFYYVLLLASVIAYGWTVHSHVHISAPLIFQFVIGLTSTTQTNSCQTILVDLFPTRSASAIAAMNLSRCLLGAAGTAVIDPLLNALGVGWTYTLVACIASLAFILWWLEIRLGLRIRKRRQARE